MKVISLTERWEGFFDYGTIDGDYKQVKCHIEIKVVNNSFEGIAIDEESKFFFQKTYNGKRFL